MTSVGLSHCFLTRNTCQVAAAKKVLFILHCKAFHSFQEIFFTEFKIFVLFFHLKQLRVLTEICHSFMLILFFVVVILSRGNFVKNELIYVKFKLFNLNLFNSNATLGALQYVSIECGFQCFYFPLRRVFFPP